MKNIWVLTTGGTIEKTYSEEEGSLKNRESLLRQKLLNKLRLPTANIQIKTIMAKDSLLMDELDRKLIYNAINETFSDADAIIVLHGTDTLEKTLKYCHQQLNSPKIPVVFTGAMKPAGFDDSDAIQNFTEAVMASQVVKPGYYLAFHGQLFVGPNVIKNKNKMTFEGSLFKQ